MKVPKIKICGMTDPGNVEAICLLQPDFLGYIFYSRSLRFVGKDPDPAIFSNVPGSIERVAVFVNEHLERMIEIMARYHIHMVQLHGMEPPETCAALKSIGKKVIKVFPADQADNASLMEQYSRCSDYFLFDTPVKTYGGSGRKFDWDVLKKLDTKKPFFLSGGIGVKDAGVIKSLSIPKMHAVDINSRFETEPGIKDIKKVEEFIKSVRDEK